MVPGAVAAGTGGQEASKRQGDLQADGISPDPGQTKQVGGEELDSRNIQEVAGGIRHFLDLGDQPKGEAVLGVFFFFLINLLFIYLFIFGCVGSSLLCPGFL